MIVKFKSVKMSAVIALMQFIQSEQNNFDPTQLLTAEGILRHNQGVEKIMRIARFRVIKPGPQNDKWDLVVEITDKADLQSPRATIKIPPEFLLKVYEIVNA